MSAGFENRVFFGIGPLTALWVRRDDLVVVRSTTTGGPPRDSYGYGLRDLVAAVRQPIYEGQVWSGRVASREAGIACLETGFGSGPARRLWFESRAFEAALDQLGPHAAKLLESASAERVVPVPRSTGMMKPVAAAPRSADAELSR